MKPHRSRSTPPATSTSPARPRPRAFPGTSGSPGGIDLFVTKLDARGSTVLYSTYIGGSGIDEARGMTIDTLGNVYVVGSTTSTNFPTVSPRQATLAGESDGFLLRVSTTGGGLGFSTYFGGSDVDEVNAVAVDAARNMYIAGSTRSANFPLLSGIQAYGGALDGFVARFLANGTLTFSTYHGGNAVDTLDGIAVDAAGNINTVGSTSSTNLPVLNATRPTYSGRVDAFISRFGPTGTLLFCSYYGGSRNDAGRAVAVTPTGWAFVTGSTTSPDFPVALPIQPAFGGELDAFLLEVSPTGAIAWSTYYGGTRSERGRALALNQAGTLILAGQTFSPDMPLLRPAQPRTGGNRDTFVVRARFAVHGVHLRHVSGRQQQRRGQRRRHRPRRPRVHRRRRVLPVAGRPGRVRRVRLRHLQRPRRRRHRWRRPRRRLGDAVRHRPGHQRRRRGSRWRRLHQRPGAGQQHASDRLLHPLPGRRIDRRVLRRSHRPVQSGPRHRHRRPALPARDRRRDPAGPRDSVTQPRHGQSRDDRRPRERRLRDRRREQPVGRRRPHDDVGRQRHRQPRRDLDRAAGDDLVPRRGLHGRRRSTSTTCSRTRMPAPPR